ncbi:MAG: DUF4115 domain-containing protein [Gammaproteobacteria bacterium]
MEQPSLIPTSLGERLRAARVARGLSIEEAAGQLKCPGARIEAIEADDRGGLAPVYYRGFVRSYAAWLGLSAEDVVEGLGREAEEGPAIESVFEIAGPVRRGERWLRAASYFVGSLLVGTLAWQMIHEAVRLADLEDSSAVVTPAMGTEAPGAPHVSASLAPPGSALPTPPRNRAGAAGAGAWAAAGAAVPACAQPLEEGKHCLELTASADSWVEITDGDGERIEQDILRGGDRRYYRGAAPFVVSIGRSSAVELSLDGEPVALVADADDVARMRLEATPAPADPGDR